MIVRTLKECENTERHIKDPEGNWQSVRMLLAKDAMGFSFHITTIHKGADFGMHYKHHLESVYCISGRGEIEIFSTGEKFAIEPGTMYALDKHDKHILRAFEEMTMACAFNPPVTGDEVHQSDGSYAIASEDLVTSKEQ
jgi:L-ectoine synthase